MLGPFYEFADRSRIFRRGVLYGAVVLNGYCYYMAWQVTLMVIDKGLVTFDIGVVLGAILTPASALLGKVFQWYNEGRVKNGDT